MIVNDYGDILEVIIHHFNIVFLRNPVNPPPYPSVILDGHVVGYLEYVSSEKQTLTVIFTIEKDIGNRLARREFRKAESDDGGRKWVLTVWEPDRP